MAKPDGGERVLAKNRKAFFQYHVLERVEAGIALLGTEVKSIREGGLSFSDAYVDFRGGELFLVGCKIAPYSHANQMNHASERDRKLLLHKREILKLGGKVTGKGLTLVPLRAYLAASGHNDAARQVRGDEQHVVQLAAKNVLPAQSGDEKARVAPVGLALTVAVVDEDLDLLPFRELGVGGSTSARASSMRALA